LLKLYVDFIGAASGLICGFCFGNRFFRGWGLEASEMGGYKPRLYKQNPRRWVSKP